MGCHVIQWMYYGVLYKCGSITAIESVQLLILELLEREMHKEYNTSSPLIEFCGSLVPYWVVPVHVHS